MCTHRCTQARQTGGAAAKAKLNASRQRTLHGRREGTHRCRCIWAARAEWRPQLLRLVLRLPALILSLLPLPFAAPCSGRGILLLLHGERLLRLLWLHGQRLLPAHGGGLASVGRDTCILRIVILQYLLNGRCKLRSAHHHPFINHTRHKGTGTYDCAAVASMQWTARS